MASGSGVALTEGPVRGHLMRLVIPMSLGIAATMTTGLVDAFWLGRLGTAELAAVSFCAPVMMAIFSVAIGLGAGTASVVSRAAGRGDRERVRRLASDSMLLSLIVVAIVSIIGIATIDPLFRAMGASEPLLEHIRDYMQVWYFGVVLIVGPMLANNVLRALGSAIAPSVLMIMIAVVNLILDPFLIFGWGPFPRLEVAGAAIATVIANALAMIGAAWLLGVREKVVTFRLPPRPVLFQSWREVAHVGLPAAGSNAINPVANTLIVAAVAGYGEAAVAGFGVAVRVEALAIIPLFALSASIGPMTGQNSGAGRNDRVRESFVESFKFALIWGMAIALLLAVFRGPIAAAFTADPDAQAATRLYLLLVPITTAGYGAVIAMSAGFNGLGRPIPGVIASFARSLVFYAPGAWIGGALAGLPGVFIGMAIGNVIGGGGAVGWTLLRAFPAKDRRVEPAE